MYPKQIVWLYIHRCISMAYFQFIFLVDLDLGNGLVNDGCERNHQFPSLHRGDSSWGSWIHGYWWHLWEEVLKMSLMFTTVERKWGWRNMRFSQKTLRFELTWLGEMVKRSLFSSFCIFFCLWVWRVEWTGYLGWFEVVLIKLLYFDVRWFSLMFIIFCL